LFSTITSLQNFMQVLGVGISPDLAVMLPYILTIIALMFPINRARQPAALNKPFERGEN
jgi:general nucleoside transport system permease protein